MTADATSEACREWQPCLVRRPRVVNGGCPRHLPYGPDKAAVLCGSWIVYRWASPLAGASSAAQGSAVSVRVLGFTHSTASCGLGMMQPPKPKSICCRIATTAGFLLSSTLAATCAATPHFRSAAHV